MCARQIVLLAPSESSHPTQLLSRQHFIPVSPLAATLMDSPASVENKRLTASLNPLAATLTKTGGREPSLAHPTRMRILSPPTAEEPKDSSPASLVCTPVHQERFRTLSQNCRRVTLQLPFWELFAGHNAERPLFSSSPFNDLHTLPSSVSRKSFPCYSYENCRV